MVLVVYYGGSVGLVGAHAMVGCLFYLSWFALLWWLLFVWFFRQWAEVEPRTGPAAAA